MVRTFFTHFRQQWMGALALFFVLTGGTAYALSGTNTVFSDDIVNEEVRTADIAQNAIGTGRIDDGGVQSSDIGAGQVTSGDVLNDNLSGTDVLNNSLKGADIDEGSLNGALIPGIATSGLVKSSGVVRVDDPVGDGQWTVVPLLTSGPFTITGECEVFVDPEGGSVGVNSLVRISSSVGPWSVDSDADFGIDEATSPSAGSQFLAGTGNVDPELDVGDYAAATSGRLLAGEALAGGKMMGTDCVFGVTGIG